MKTAPLLLVLLCLGVLAPPADAAPEDWRAEINTTLDETKVSVNFEDTPLDEALNFITQAASLNIWLDPAFSEGKWRDRLLLTLKADKLEARSLLELLTEIMGIAWELRWGGIFVATRERMAAMPRAVKTWFLGESAENNRLLARLEKPINLNFEETPAQSAVEFLSAIGQVNIVVLPEAAERADSALVGLRGSSVSLKHALAAILLPHGLTYEVKDGVAMVKLLPQDLEDLWREPARRILKETKLKRYGGGEGPDDTRLARTIAKLGERVRVPIVLDYTLESTDSYEPVVRDASLRGISVESILNLITFGPNLAWDLRWEVVFVSTPERLEQFPRSPLPPAKDPEGWERDLRRRLQETISFDFEGARLADAVEFIRATKNLNLVLEPNARQAAEVLPVTLTVKDVTVEHALALLLYPRTQRFELKHEVVLIRKQ